MAEMMRMMGGGERPADLPELSVEEKVALLKSTAEIYRMGACTRFKIGDIVTPTDRAILKGRGEPHVVVEARVVADSDDPILAANSPQKVGIGDDDFGAILDLRVVRLAPNGRLVAWWVEGWKFEPWTAPVAKAA